MLGADSLSVKTYVACTGILYVKFLATTMVQGMKTFRAGNRPPEDVKLSLARGMPEQTYGLVETKDAKILRAREVEYRWKRIIANDLESLPFAMFVFAGGLFAESSETVQIGAMVMYTAARLAHTYSYAHEMQPHRGLFWGIGALAILIGIGNATIAVLFK